MTKKILLGILALIVIVAAAVATKEVHPDYGTTPENAEAVFVFGKFFRPTSTLDIHRLQEMGCDVSVETNGEFAAFCPKVEALRVSLFIKAQAVGLTVIHGKIETSP